MAASARSARGSRASRPLRWRSPRAARRTDSLGYDESRRRCIRLTGPASYPNPFRDLLGETDAAISAKINNAFNQLFHGDPSTQAISYAAGTDQAYIQDTFTATSAPRGWASG